jgi:hypothetical protein
MIYVYDNLRNIALTNDQGFSGNASIPIANTIAVANWPGYNAYQPTLSFEIPLNASINVLSNSIYRFNQPGIPYLTPYLGDIYEANVTGFTQPHWWLTIANDLRVVMVDTSVVPNRVIDYVEFSGPNSSRDLTSEIWVNYDTDTQANDLWDTNWFGTINIPQGLVSQIDVSLGLYSPNTANGGPWPVSSPANIAQQQENWVDGFRAFFHLGPKYNNVGSQQAIAAAEMTNAIQAPFTPTATVVQHVSWQANDPLVHYLATDLNWASAIKYDRNVTALMDSSDGDNLGLVNTRYAPWGKFMFAGIDPVDQNSINLAYKDPLVVSSDGWDFPLGAASGSDWLGRVHRGTPWQTIYLKSTNILAWAQGNASGLITWRDWTGDFDTTDAAAMAPVQDWHVASLLTSLLDTNNPASLLSINNPNNNAWQILFNGLTALTNTAPPEFDTIVISSNSPQAAIIANAIQFTRANQPGQFFRDIGDVLATPQLTGQSPFLNLNSNISDQAYETIPSQLLPLLRADSVGSVASANGPTVIRFTGSDGHDYAIEASPDLVNWTRISTNWPTGDVISFTNSPTLGVGAQFYRSILLIDGF